MTLPQTPRSVRSLTIAIVAGLMTVTSFAATVSPANAAGVYYRAELAAPVEASKDVIGGVLWVCEGTSCIAGKASSRPVAMCKRVAREHGEIANFTAGGEALSAEELAKCNGK